VTRIDIPAARAIRDAWRGAVPAGVSMAVWGLDVGESDLVEADARWVERAVEKRRLEFLRGRACARAALSAAGGPAGAELPVEASRAPAWPEGYIGSITHAHGVVGAAAAPIGVCGGLGIDVERGTTLPDGTARHILRPEEAEVLAPPFDLVAFSAKESIFKAVHPLARRWIDFEEARVTVEADGVLGLAWAVDGPPVPSAALRGRYAVGPDWVATVVWLEGAAAEPSRS